MGSKFGAIVGATLFAVAVGGLIVSVYGLVYSRLQGDAAIRRALERNNGLPAPMSDEEAAAFRGSVQHLQMDARLQALYLASGSCILILIRFVPRIVARAKRDIDHRHLRWRRMVFVFTATIVVLLGILGFNHYFSRQLPDPAAYVLTQYQSLLAPQKAGLSLYEQFLLETDPDGDGLMPDKQQIAATRAQLHVDPEGLTHASAPLLVPKVVLKSRVAAADLLVGPSRDSLYLLDELTGKLHAIDLQSHRLLAEAELSPTTQSMCFSGDGETIYAAAIDSIWVVRRKDLTVLNRIELDFTPSDVVCVKSGELMISGIRHSGGFSPSQEGLFVLDVPSSSLLGELELRDARDASLSYLPTDDLLFLSPFRGYQWAICAEQSIAQLVPQHPGFPVWANLTGKEGEAAFDWYDPVKWKAYGPYSVSPDARFAMFSGRTRVEYGEGTAEDGTIIDLRAGIIPVAKVPAHIAVAWDIERQIVMIAFPDGGGEPYGRHQGAISRLSIYSLPDWQQHKTYQLPRPAYQLAWDSTRKQLIAALDEDKDVEAPKFKERYGVWELGGDVDAERSLSRFRESNRVTGRSNGPLCVFNLSTEVD